MGSVGCVGERKIARGAKVWWKYKRRNSQCKKRMMSMRVTSGKRCDWKLGHHGACSWACRRFTCICAHDLWRSFAMAVNESQQSEPMALDEMSKEMDMLTSSIIQNHLCSTGQQPPTLDSRNALLRSCLPWLAIQPSQCNKHHREWSLPHCPLLLQQTCMHLACVTLSLTDWSPSRFFLTHLLPDQPGAHGKAASRLTCALRSTIFALHHQEWFFPPEIPSLMQKPPSPLSGSISWGAAPAWTHVGVVSPLAGFSTFVFLRPPASSGPLSEPSA